MPIVTYVAMYLLFEVATIQVHDTEVIMLIDLYIIILFCLAILKN